MKQAILYVGITAYYMITVSDLFMAAGIVGRVMLGAFILVIPAFLCWLI